MLKKIFFLLFSTSCLTADIADLITYVPSDLYSVTHYESDAYGVKVKIHDWYHKTDELVYCEFENDWCFPKFYPTLAKIYGKKLKEKETP